MTSASTSTSRGNQESRQGKGHGKRSKAINRGTTATALSTSAGATQLENDDGHEPMHFDGAASGQGITESRGKQAPSSSTAAHKVDNEPAPLKRGVSTASKGAGESHEGDGRGDGRHRTIGGPHTEEESSNKENEQEEEDAQEPPDLILIGTQSELPRSTYCESKWATTFLTSEILKERIVRSKIELQRVLDKEGRGAHVCSIHGISTDQSCKCREQDLEEWINDWNKLKRLGKAWRSKAEEKERQVAMEE